MERKYKLAHPVFIFAVIILIVNDFYLKHTFHNAFTGKLSDFVGLFAFPFFWSIVLPGKTRWIHLLTVVLFLFWKTVWSQPLIDFINLFGFHTSRTVDYSDYIALVSVPFSYFTLSKRFLFKAKPVLLKVFFLISLFSFVATTQKRGAPTYEDGFKSIDIYNQSTKKLTIIVDFLYDKASLDGDSSLNNEFNRIDTINLIAGGSERFITPIQQVDSARFPLNFKITVLNVYGKKLKTYSKKMFLNEAKTDYNGEGTNEFSSSWNLVVGEKTPEQLSLYNIYGRWRTGKSSKEQHTFEIREHYYYDVDPDSEVNKYEIQDSTIIIAYPKIIRRGKIEKLDGRNLTIKWDDRGTLRYEKLYD